MERKGERLVREIVSVSATHVSLSEIDDGAVEIRRAADLNSHILTAADAVREREREVVRGARARRKRWKESSNATRATRYSWVGFPFAPRRSY